MSGRYAERTDVSSDRSRAEIERVLQRYGATAFQYGWTIGVAAIMFEIAGRRILFRLPLPDPNERRFTHTPGKGLLRDQAAREKEYEQAVRQRWRALALVIKAKLEATAAGITTVEQEFLAHILLPDGRTVGEHVTPAIAAAYESGQMPALLPGGES
ncbi:hypothetical protein C1I95_24725 [Micromonospora craterilacus]|uniref:Uncharacterized protein n=1 Tax=Micromonospora craterilacus TaxID=1655439 RepID=A0A2W2EH64_9ACTN|nr:hypothetical protein [Micromonospora craterilacus]PZG12950.1 hypothetical protein C1I95_24725 [Micromonospora craterilacus]